MRGKGMGEGEKVWVRDRRRVRGEGHTASVCKDLSAGRVGFRWQAVLKDS